MLEIPNENVMIYFECEDQRKVFNFDKKVIEYSILYS